jgi:hypothetical protein
MLAPGKHVYFRFAAGRTMLRMTYRKTSPQISSVVLSKRSAPKDPQPKRILRLPSASLRLAQNDRKSSIVIFLPAWYDKENKRKRSRTMFEGFSPETVDFLWGIRMNNNREWFLEHKKDYVNYLYEPMKALGKELFEPFLEKPGSLLKVSRIYRDARLHYPVPYKESLWICIRQDVEWWAENPCLYFEITPEGISYGFIHWRPRTSRYAWASSGESTFCIRST